MTYEEFDKVFDDLIAECRGMRETKGPEYAGLKDRLANFKQAAAYFGVSPLVVCGIFKNKHDQAIAAFVRGGYKGSEPIRGRIVDAIVYLALLYGLIVEAEGRRCSACGGSGTVEHSGNTETCPACKGSGKAGQHT